MLALFEQEDDFVGEGGECCKSAEDSDYYEGAHEWDGLIMIDIGDEGVFMVEKCDCASHEGASDNIDAECSAEHYDVPL